MNFFLSIEPALLLLALFLPGVGDAADELWSSSGWNESLELSDNFFFLLLLMETSLEIFGRGVFRTAVVLCCADFGVEDWTSFRACEKKTLSDQLLLSTTIH